MIIMMRIRIFMVLMIIIEVKMNIMITMISMIVIITMRTRIMKIRVTMRIIRIKIVMTITAKIFTTNHRDDNDHDRLIKNPIYATPLKGTQ